MVGVYPDDDLWTAAWAGEFTGGSGRPMGTGNLDLIPSYRHPRPTPTFGIRIFPTCTRIFTTLLVYVFFIYIRGIRYATTSKRATAGKKN